MTYESGLPRIPDLEVPLRPDLEVPPGGKVWYALNGANDNIPAGAREVYAGPLLEFLGVAAWMIVEVQDETTTDPTISGTDPLSLIWLPQDQ